MNRDIRFPYLVALILLIMSGCSSQITDELRTPNLVTNISSHKMVFIQGDCIRLDGTYFHLLSPSKTICLDDYYFDIYEVSNRQYAEFLNENSIALNNIMDWLDVNSENTHLHLISKQWIVDAGYEDHPVVEVSWYGAEAYCSWRGLRLPTEVEWDYAGMGPDQNPFPWGEDQPTCEYTNAHKSCFGDTAEVGYFSKDKSAFGIYDMAGNVSEWVSDWYEDDFFYLFPKNNPKGPIEGQERIVKGGFWNSPEDSFILSFLSVRLHHTPDTKLSLIGFRCANSP